MRNIYLSSGHSNAKGRDNGAVVGSLTEGDLAMRVRSQIAGEITLQGGTSIIDDPRLITIETVVAWKKKITERDIAIDIHFNAGVSTARGVEVVVPNKPTELELKLADHISDIISEETSTPERGKVKNFASDGVILESDTARKQLAWMTLPGTTVLIECEFITNTTAIQTFLSKLPSIAKRIATLLVTLQRVS